MKLKNLDKNDINLLKKAFVYSNPYRNSLIILFLSIVAIILLGLISPYMYGLIISAIAKNEGKNIFKYISILIVTSCVQLVVSYFQLVQETYINSNIVKNLQNDMYKKIINFPIKAFDEIPIGEFISRLQNDCFTLTNIITGDFIGVIIDVLNGLIIGVIVFSINITLGIIVMVAFPISYYVFLYFGKKLKNKSRELKKIGDVYISNINQSFSGIREIRALGLKKYNLTQFNNITEKIKVKDIEMAKLNAKSQNISLVINIGTSMAVIGIGSWFVLKNKLSLELFIAFIAYSKQFSAALMNVTRMNSKIQQGLASLERIFSLMDNFNYKIQKFGQVKLNTVEGNINFENVIFSYDDINTVIDNITFKTEPNKKLAIVGKSGSGKSTILSLILRLYDYDNGDIKIDGISIKELDENSITTNISIVRQEPFLFNMSIKENIKIGILNCTEDEIYNACKLAYIHDFIMSLPNQYDSIVGENGVNLSGGQKQRLAIARAIIKKSKILLFDEATSSLDNQSQQFIKKTIDVLSENRTIIIVAHRLSTIIDCDEIIVLSNGRVVGCGNHKQLINENIYYKKLYDDEIKNINAIT
ncbi:ABC transporter ATP-binding protein [Clostridium senegalense]|uniref:ABC transporter ATP-binding protein n=1 Tax=Clostridium senegalense TaxID=1465809 RepID=A0A6M0H343_9CLOT|nr:ABC transporter ATP-binding protein [Clostridium senegalense]NEU05135.1 ABC transporter ATP-binding protein [Clostridium senegalense]